MHRFCLAGPALIVGGCAAPMSTLDTQGPIAASIATLWWVMLAGAAALTLLVLVLLALSFRRRKRSVASGEALWLGWLGVAMPGVVLTALLSYALVLGNRTLPHAAPNLVVVEATGQQWFWTFRQPGASGRIVTRGTLHIPAGRPVDVHLASADVIHSFWVPRLGGKMDAIPGQVNVLRILADKPGAFEGQCAEFCGLNHATHRFRVIAHDAAGWAAFQQSTGR